MLDLISLTMSTLDDRWSSGQGGLDGPWTGHAGQTVSVVIVPSVTEDHLSYINNKTNFYKVSF